MQWLSKTCPLEITKSTSTKGYNVPSERVTIISFWILYSLYCCIIENICCRRFILQGETEESFAEDKKDSSKSISAQNSCSFELEVCLLEIDPNGKRLVGIRRKRLKGDAWVYKRVCEEILALTTEDISTDTEISSESKYPIWNGSHHIIVTYHQS